MMTTEQAEMVLAYGATLPRGDLRRLQHDCEVGLIPDAVRASVVAALDEQIRFLRDARTVLKVSSAGVWNVSKQERLSRRAGFVREDGAAPDGGSGRPGT